MSVHNIGLVGLADKGGYDASVTYHQGNFVYYNGSTWLAKRDTQGNPPVEGNDWKYLARGLQGATAVTSVNGMYGDVILNKVSEADNLYSPDATIDEDTYVFRTAGGSADLNSGEAGISKIEGNCTTDGLTISAATPTSFKAMGLNQFKPENILTGYTINSAGAVVAQAGSYVAYVKAVGDLTTGYTAFSPNSAIERIGWCATVPTTATVIDLSGASLNAQLSHITFANTGYVCVAITNLQLCVHPAWSGYMDTTYEAYSESTIAFPTHDADGDPLPPTQNNGFFPSVGNVRDILNFVSRTYTQYVGYLPYSAENHATVVAMGVAYIEDNSHIFYVLTSPMVYSLANTVSGTYTVNDFGTEEWVGTTVGVVTEHTYGQNLRDKLRRDVLTISAQELSAAQQAQARENIGAGNVKSVNNYQPDASGNVDVLKVPMAENLYSPDNSEDSGTYIFRTAGGSADLSGESAQVIRAQGNCAVGGRQTAAFGNWTCSDAGLAIAGNLNTFADNAKVKLAYYANVQTPLTGCAVNLTYALATQKVTIQLNGGAVTQSEALTVAQLASNYGIAISGMVEEAVSASTGVEGLTVAVNLATWKTSPLGGTTGSYTFTYNGSAWTYNSAVVNLANYGITVTGTPAAQDNFTVSYTAPTSNFTASAAYTPYRQGTITVATPTYFKGVGLNSFDVTKTVTFGENTYYYIKVCQASSTGWVIYDDNKAVTDIRYSNDFSSEGTTIDDFDATAAINYCTFADTFGWIYVATTDTTKLCVHPSWSGYMDSEYAAHAETLIAIPTTDKNGNALPTASYGMPAVGDVRDEINFDIKSYTQRIGRMAYSVENLVIVQQMGVAYDWDYTNIFYVLASPVLYTLASSVTTAYTVHDFGTEEFVGTNVALVATHLYGANLRDKLRRDVVTISAQDLTEQQKAQVRTNLGVPSLTQLNSVNDSLIAQLLQKEGATTLGNSFIKFTNGLQLCWGSISFNILDQTSNLGSATVPYTTQTASFELQFISNPSVLISAKDGGSGVFSAELESVSKNEITVTYFGGGLGNINGIVFYLAIGRWKN